MNTLTRKASIVLLMVFAINVTANAGEDSEGRDLGIKGFGGKLQYVSPSNVDGAIGLGVHVDFGNVTEDIKIFPSISYWKSSTDLGGFFGSSSLDITQIGIQIDSRYYLDSDADMKFYAGGGGGIFLHSFSISDASGTTFGTPVNTTDFGFNVIAGVEKGILFGEAKYTVVSEYSTISVGGGVTFGK